MRKLSQISLALLALCTASTTGIGGETLYQITSGTYTMVGGIWGSLTLQLPGEEQAFVRLAIEPSNNLAELTILKEDRQTPFLSLTNGIVEGSVIRFKYQVPHPYPSLEEGTVDYTVTNTPGLLLINGNRVYTPVCCDIPYFFAHSNVVASAMPVVSIRVTEVEVSWSSEPGQTYQAQFRSDMTTGSWTNLGAPVTASASKTSVIDRVQPGQPPRFYQVLKLK